MYKLGDRWYDGTIEPIKQRNPIITAIHSLSSTSVDGGQLREMIDYSEWFHQTPVAQQTREGLNEYIKELEELED